MKHVRDVMTDKPAYCTPDTGLEEVARMMVEYDAGEIPVVDNPQDLKPVGVITDRDIVARCIAQGINPLIMTAKTSMSAPVVTATQDLRLDECAGLMGKNQIRRLPVVDDSGKLIGIISDADIARFASNDVKAHLFEKLSEPSETESKVAA